jgi:lipopolysaccharide transport system permease protein
LPGAARSAIAPGIMSLALQATRRRTETLDLTPEPTLGARQRMALRDVGAAIGQWRLCAVLAWLDIKLRYRGSVLGPFWLTLSTAAMVAAMGVLYAALFHMDLHEYLPFLALSLVLWGFVAAIIGDACQSFTASEGMIRAMRLPFTLYGGRIVLRNVLVLAHNLVVIVVVFAIFGIAPGLTGLLALPAFAIWLIDGIALCLLLGAVCARFRDIPPIVNSVLQMIFFVTPVIWKPEAVGPERQWLLPYNPFFAILETVRGPLLGSVPSAALYVSALAASLLLWVLAWLLFARVRGRIAFWL